MKQITEKCCKGFAFCEACAEVLLATGHLEVSTHAVAHWDTIRPIEKEFKRLLLQIADLKCMKCGSPKRLTVDHIVPLSRGGQHILSNMQVLCRACNLEKADKLEDCRTDKWKEAIKELRLRLH